MNIINKWPESLWQWYILSNKSVVNSFQKNKRLYYAAIEKVQKKNEITEWLQYFINVIYAAQLEAEKYISINKTSKATATRDLQHLTEMGLFILKGGGRSTHYLIKH